MKRNKTIFSLLLLLVFNSLVFLIRSPLLLTMLLLLLIPLLRPQKQAVVERLKMLIPVGVLIITLQLIFLSSIPITQRFLFGYLAAVRIILISLSVLLFLSVVSLAALIRLFDFLPRRWLLLLLITAYLIPNVLNDAKNIKTVQQSRGLKMGGLNIFNSLVAVIVPLIHRVFQQAETVSLTIVSRGFED